jgi:3-(3-hydroxy-phenyl)propionate hydroxylase
MARQEEGVLIAGAGPIGLAAAARLVRSGIPVTVLEAEPDLLEELRASTFHPPTLDMLDDLGAAAPLIARGIVAPLLQYRTKADGKIATFDFGVLADVTRHPYRVQSEQFKLTRILYEGLRTEPLFHIEFGCSVEDVAQDASGVRVTARRDGRTMSFAAPWLIGADGARSAVRRAAGIAFDGFTWPERFLVVSTPFDFTQVSPDLVSVSYCADPQQWHFLLQVPGLWRAMFPIAQEIDDERAVTPEFVQAQMAGIVPGIARYDIAHTTLYRVHQRVAQTYRLGRVMLAGDAAHINNPLGGMGLNGGVHDAIDLTARLARVWAGDAPPEELDRYDRQRRGITVEHVQKQSIENKRNLEARDPAEHAAFKGQLRRAAADPALAHDYLLGVSMIKSLRRAAELG